MVQTFRNYHELIAGFEQTLTDKGVSYALEKDRVFGGHTFWLDRSNNIGFKVNPNQVSIFQLKGVREFNIEAVEGLLEAPVEAVVVHIHKLLSKRIYQEEVYKLGKLCWVRQCSYVDGKKVKMSMDGLYHWLSVVPFLKKKMVMTVYEYSEQNGCEGSHIVRNRSEKLSILLV